MKNIKTCSFFMTFFIAFYLNVSYSQETKYFSTESVQHSQNCPISNLNITTQDEINNFVNRWPGCTELTGTLNIGIPFGASDITHLTGLQTIKKIGGQLRIFFNPLLVDLNGLHNLTEIEGGIGISNNNALKSIAALQKLSTVSGHIGVANNPALMDIEGFKNLNYVEKGVLIDNNSSLENLHGLRNIERIGEGLVVSNNSSLENLHGLRNIERIGEGLVVSNNSSLENLHGLRNIKTIGEGLVVSNNENLNSVQGLEVLISAGAVSITNNPLLKDFSGLDSLRIINQNLFVQGNDGLVSLHGLDSLQVIGTSIIPDALVGVLKISNNTHLKDISALSKLTHLNDGLEISNNMSLKSLNGLENIQYIGTDLTISNNDSLLNLDALNKLQKIGGLSIYNPWFVISGNQMLEDITGLSTLDSIFGSFGISNNPKLTQLNGLEKLSYIRENFWISSLSSIKNLNGLNEFELEIHEDLLIANNDSLSTLEGIEALVNLGGGIRINDNPSLENLDGLNNIETLNGNLTISRNTSLNSIAALMSLKSMNGGNIGIRDNDLLPSLSGLDNLNPESVTQILISRNPKLSMCSVLGICSFLDLPKFAQFNDNAPDCNSRQEVKDICEFRCEVSVVITSDKDTLCAGEELILRAAVTETTGNVSYLWSTGETSPTIRITGEMSGMYMLTVTDSEDCTATANKTISVITLPSFEIVVTPTSCGDNNGKAELLHDESEYQYLWQNGSTDRIAENLPSGEISVRITDGYSCIYEEFDFIEGSEALEVVIVGDLTICDGDVGQLAVNENYDSYQWSDGSNEDKLLYTQNGVYSLTVMRGPCTAQDSVEVIVFDNPTIALLTSDTSITVTITMGSTPYEILWNTGDTTSTIKVALSGVYSVTVTDLNGCNAVGEVDFIPSHVFKSNLMAVALYPNPARNIITLQLSDSKRPFSIGILDVYGRMVLQSELSGDRIDLDISTLPPGAYVLRVLSEGLWVGRFIKN